MKEMRALVKYEQGVGKLEIRQVPIPCPQYGEVLVKIEACGICGTDLKIYDDKFIYKPPVIIGHEFSGRIAQLGEGVKDWKINDRVVCEQHFSACGICEFCITERRQFCYSKRSPGYLSDGAFAEFINVNASLLHKIPNEVTFEEATLIEPMAVAFYGILERTGIKPNEECVVILGSGAIALLALQIIKASSTSRVFITGLEADEKYRFQVAKEFDVDRIINTANENPINVVLHNTRNRGADIVIDLSGSPEAINQGLEMLKRDGKFCALGIPSKDITVPWSELILKAAKILFSFSSDYKSWERCISLVKAGKVKLEKFTQDIYKLEQWESAFKRARSENVLKVIIKL